MEQRFTLPVNGTAVPCVFESCANPRRLVLAVHGLGGSSEDPIQAAINEEMCCFGGAVLRFDLPAHGRHPSIELALPDCRATLLAAAAEARRRCPEIETLCIFATGFGAYLTLICLPELLASGPARLVIQTPSILMHQTLLAMTRLSRETFRAMDRYTLPSPRPLTVTYKLYEQLTQAIAMDTYDAPILILQGETDSYISMDTIENFHRINEDSRLVIIPGTSHRFLESGAWDMVLDLTRDWFTTGQVTLTDWL